MTTTNGCNRKTLLSSALFLWLALLSPSIQALDAQGRLYAAGYVETDEQNLRDTVIAISRYDNEGIDTTFGIGGLSLLENVTFGFGPQAFAGPLRHGVAMDLVLNEEDGETKIYVVGTAIDLSTGLPRAIIAKFNLNGTLDTDFNMNVEPGGPGYVWLADGPSVATSISIAREENVSFQICGNLITPENRYVGFVTFSDIDGRGPAGLSISSQDIKLNAILRDDFNGTNWVVGKSIQNGTPIPFFGSSTLANEITTEYLGTLSGEFRDLSFTIGEVEERAATIHIYVVGIHGNKGLLARFVFNMVSLELDTSFGQNGFVTGEFGNRQTEFNAVKVVPSFDDQARILVCGTARSLESRMFVTEYDTNGALISSFGDNGIQFINEGPNVQTFGQDLVVIPFGTGSLFGCPSGSLTGLFAIGRANNRTPLIANLECSDGQLQTTYGDKGINSLATEALTSQTVLKEQTPIGQSLPVPSISPYIRNFTQQEGNLFAVNLTSPAFILEPGRYFIDAQAPISDVLAHKLQLWNVTLQQQQDIGDTIWNSSGILSEAFLKSMVFVPESMTFELRHWFTQTGPKFSVGQAAGFSGLAEVFAQMNIQQL